MSTQQMVFDPVEQDALEHTVHVPDVQYGARKIPVKDIVEKILIFQGKQIGLDFVLPFLLILKWILIYKFM